MSTPFAIQTPPSDGGAISFVVDLIFFFYFPDPIGQRGSTMDDQRGAGILEIDVPSIALDLINAILVYENVAKLSV